ncbi:pectinesterase family protein [Seiridium cupressi]
MLSLSSLVLLASSAFPLTAVASKTHPSRAYAGCQKKTADPLSGCASGTLYVSQNDTSADFSSIQAAIASLPNNTDAYTILIAPGIYTEQLNVTRQGPLTLLGQSDLPSRLQAYSDVFGSNATDKAHANDVQIYWNSANFNKTFTDNVYTGVLTIGPTLNSTLTGSGPTGFAVPDDTPFGCSNFSAYNIDFRNEQYPYSNGPAHALGVSRANAGFYSCGFYSWQDTIYVGKLGNAYFHDTIVAGETDFLYGFGTLYITNSTLSLRSCGGGTTAWKGTNTTFENKYGVYITNSQVLASNSSIAPSIVDKCSLGRPWNAQHRSLFANTYFDASILPAGYTPWSGATNGNIGINTTMAVYDVYGPGYNEAAEAASNVTLIFDEEEAQPYLSPQDVFMTEDGSQPNVAWIDFDGSA